MSNDVVIQVRGLGKRYRLAHTAQRTGGYRTLREELGALPGRWLRRWRENRVARDEFWALRDLSFEVRSGEVLGVIGRNGAGKSTLLKILSRIVEPTAGEAEICGRIGSLLEVGTGFHPELTGRENIFLSGALLGMRRPEVRARFEEIVAFAEVERFLDTPCKHYSSGMYTRLGFAVAAHLDAAILLVDEVLAVGDAEFQRKCLGKMTEIASGGRTVLFVSHDLGAVAELSSRVLLLTGGTAEFCGLPAQAIAAYRRARQLAGEVDLTTWNDRIGSGEVRAMSLSLLDRRGVPTSVVAFGEPYTFRISLTADRARSLILGVSIRNSRGNLVQHFASTDDDASITVPQGVSEITLSVPAVIMNDGPYSVSIWISDTLNLLFDRVNECFPFVVSSAAEGAIRCQSSVRQRASWIVSNVPVHVRTS